MIRANNEQDRHFSQIKPYEQHIHSHKDLSTIPHLFALTVNVMFNDT